MRSGRPILASVLMLSALATGSSAWAERPEKHRYFPRTIVAEIPDHAIVDGPLFLDLRESLVNGTIDVSYDVTASVLGFQKPYLRVEGPTSIARIISDIQRDCRGPFSIDEGFSRGQEWVQVSYLCRVADDASVRKYFSFTHSPEVSVDFTLDDGRVHRVAVAELIGTPPENLVAPMNAYDLIKGGD